MLAILDRLMEGGAIDLEVRSPAGDTRTARLPHRGAATLALTEPGALLPGLGFEFWFPDVPARVGTIVEGSPAGRAGLQVR